ncbi:MAG: Ig-like domain-containing protein [Lachnospiraceae bacterium]|nr:Ig-like domain-containing protein [Lachnospiraceae bacterium]
MAKRSMKKWVVLTLIFALTLSIFPSAGIGAKKAAKVKSVKIKNSDSGVLVMKKKEKATLKIAINGKVSRKAWKEVKFRSSSKKIVTVSAKGKMKAKKKGKTTITVTSKKGQKKATLKVIVGTKVKSMQMSVASKTLLPSQTFQLSATVLPKNASYKEVRWSSSDQKVAEVSSGGLVRAMGVGTVTITAASQDGTKKKAYCQITVKESDDNNSTIKPAPTNTPTKSPTGSEEEPKETDDSQKPSTENPTEGPTGNPSGPTATPTGTASGQPTDGPVTPATMPPVTIPPAVPTSTPTLAPTRTPTPDPVSVLEGNCSDMTCSGSYAGTITKPFDGVALYGNGDGCKTTYFFDGINKKYRIVIKGASNNSTAAGVSLYIGGKKKGAVAFTGTELQEQSIDFKMQDEETGELEIEFRLETDNGSNDTYLNSFELFFLGDIPEPPAAPVPAGGAAYTGNYRNMFRELGYSEAEIDAKVEDAWQQLFYGTEEERIYYPVEPDMAYIYTADTNDVRSEGMSYGMMICVQMDKQEEFDRLWKWAKTYMQHTSGEFKNYFAWKCSTSGSKMDNTPASDGEEYFATALLFASARWGDSDGIYNYNEQAQIILDAMLHQKDDGQGVNMFDSTHKMPVFCPIGNAATYTDPSYHLPAFYEVWAELAEKDNEFWSEAAEASRAYFQKATNAQTGLGPDYSEYNGTPKHEGDHADFRFDAWRIAANIACDYAWWGKNNWATTHANTLHAFFTEKGVDSYGNQWTLEGKELSTDHSPGLVAMNAVASLAASDKKAWAFLEDFWNISPTTGKYRYYDGCLYMMGLLHCSGKFRTYLPDGSKPAASATITADSYEFDKNESEQKPIRVTMTLNDNTLSEIRNGGTVLAKGTDYLLQGNIVTIEKSYLASLQTGTASLTFVFSAGRNAVLTLTIKDTTPGAVPDIKGPFEEIPATAFTDSNDVTVEDGTVTFNSTDSWISFSLDFGTDSVSQASVYVKEPNNSGQIFIYLDGLTSQVSTIYNLGNGSWKETSNNCTINSGGTHTVYVKTNKAGVMLKWLKFTKK